MIKFVNTSFEYDTKTKVIHDMNLTINEGETVGIIGANGAGKSTILNLIVGVIMPTAGEIYVTDLPVKKSNLKVIRKKVGFTFQEADNQLFMPTVYEDIAFRANQENKPKEEIDSIVEKALTEVNSLHLAQKASYKLSGGEKRVVTIATALACEPEILILDEPSVGLDPKSRRQLINLLKHRQETKIITTHDMDMALELCDRILVVNNGIICGDDKPLKVFNNKKLIAENHLEIPLCMQGCPNCN